MEFVISLSILTQKGGKECIDEDVLNRIIETLQSVQSTSTVDGYQSTSDPGGPFQPLIPGLLNTLCKKVPQLVKQKQFFEPLYDIAKKIPDQPSRVNALKHLSRLNPKILEEDLTSKVFGNCVIA